MPTYLYPSDKSEYFIARFVSDWNTDNSSESEEIPQQDVTQPIDNQDSVMLEMIHTALKIRMDCEECPGHNAAHRGIDQEHIEKVIPDSLYMFLSVLLGGISRFGEKTYDAEKSEEDLNTRVCNIAQDIVYAVSKHRKLTPKRVGIGLTVHQATRSEYLLNLLHSAGHSVGIDTVRRIDTTIATGILDKFQKTGVYIPDGIIPYSPGQLILASCDNIDVLEATVDGKNTFHCTQMMVWQRGPTPKRDDHEVLIEREKSLKKEVLKELHRLNDVNKTSSRPEPLFQTCIEKNDVNSWIEGGTERKVAKLKDHSWALSRLHGKDTQMVPSWAAFNEIISDETSHTTPGMMPILQAPADDKDTLVTVLNRFKDITTYLGQDYTVIAMEQPLYSKAKELAWKYPDKYKNVILLTGDLHILFNFLKVIGQHFDNAGLDDVWIESGLYAQKSTHSMLEGKAYYRAVPGHCIAYEALFRLKWNKFKGWLQDKSEQAPDEELWRKVSQVEENFQSDEHEQSAVLIEEICKRKKSLQKCSNLKMKTHLIQTLFIGKHTWTWLKYC